MITTEITISKEQLLSFTQPMQFIGINWETYEAISEELGESSPIHLTYEKGLVTVMPITKLHEALVRLLERLIGIVSLVTQSIIYPTGSASIRSESRLIGVEPDLSFFVGKIPPDYMDRFVHNEVEFLPNIVVEIDIGHRSDDKFSIYAELGISEFWHFSGEELKIFRLNENANYDRTDRSLELPILTEQVLTELLMRGQNEEEQFKLLSDFQEWLQENK